MYEIGLHVALDPARALAQPVLHLRVGLFQRRRVKDDRTHAIAFQAQAQVTILRHIVGVPPP